MPSPKKYKSQKKFMKACMHATKAEGKPQKQGIAQCLNMWRSKNESFVKHYFEKINE